MANTTTSLNNWNFHTNHVQSELDGGEFLNAASTLIAAGPPLLRQTNTRADNNLGFGQINQIAWPIGVVENIGLAQNRQLQRLFEIGSKRSYFVNGRNIGQINLARTMFHGPSLMRALYAYYPASKLAGSGAANLRVGQDAFTAAAPDIEALPGFGDLFVNLDSDLFDQPFGLLFLMKDVENEMFGAFYLENAYINGHQFSISATSTLIGEAVSVQYDRLVPINVQAVSREDAEKVNLVSNLLTGTPFSV